MSNNIQQNGGTILLRQNGPDIQYSSDAGSSWNTVSSFPVQITNTNPLSTNVLTVKFDTDLVITSANNYFICNSDYITINGQNNTCIFYNVSNCLGLIQNGTSEVNGKSNIIVMNIGTATSGTSNLADGGAWVCQSYFGSTSNNVLVSNCFSTGIIDGLVAGGICGVLTGYSGVILVTKCYSTGIINGTGAGGICGAGFGAGTNGLGIVTECFSTGEINGFWSGGICGAFTGYESGRTIVSDCYSRGQINGNAGGICAPASEITNITNCYSSGLINGGEGIYGEPKGSNATSQNCYVANGSWSDNTANANLTGTPSSIPGVGSVWESTAVNTPYLLSPLQMTITNVVLGTVDLTIDIIGTNLLSATSILLNDSITPDSFVINSDTSITVTLAEYIIGGINSVQVFNPLNLSATFLVNPPLAPVCFPAGTPVLTDQGIINIEKINPKIHTIQNKKIVAVTQTITNEKHLVCIEKDALGENKPNQRTLISQCHNVEFNGKFMRAKYLKYAVDNKKSVHNVKYENQILYNVLMEEHEVMSVNNMLVETLDPEHFIAKLYTGKISESEKHNLIVEINECMKNNDMEKCKQICKKIK
jgi:hypothetical protein